MLFFDYLLIDNKAIQSFVIWCESTLIFFGKFLLKNIVKIPIFGQHTNNDFWMNKISILLIFFTFLISCQKSNEGNALGEEITLSENDDYFVDGDYCAEVNYYNPNTGTQSSYTLTVEVSDNELVKINFPNGGYFDDEITNGALDSSGEASFTSNKGYDYTVKITGRGSNCFENVPMAEQCNGITENGDQCQNETDNPNGFCWQHEDQE